MVRLLKYVNLVFKMWKYQYNAIKVNRAVSRSLGIKSHKATKEQKKRLENEFKLYHCRESYRHKNIVYIILQDFHALKGKVIDFGKNFLVLEYKAGKGIAKQKFYFNSIKIISKYNPKYSIKSH